MKLRSFFFGALACIAMASCSSDDDSSSAASEGKSYVSVRLTMPGNTTRAWDDTNADGSFAEAPKEELKVKEAIFFFFNEFEEGVANATIIGGDELTWDHGTGNVDDKANAIIVLDTRVDPSYPDPLELPTKVAVVLNPTEKVKDLKSSQPSVAQLKAIVEDYQYKEPPFMMSSSVYAKDGKIVATTDISNNVFNNADDALKSPVKIPVEKVVAKISTIYSKAEGDVFQLYIDKAATATDVKVRLYKEWWIDNTQPKAYLVKNLSTAYTESGSINKNWWNDETNRRSYWANTLDYDADAFGHYAFNTKSGKDQFCLEHTSAPSEAEADKQTKVVFAGQIVDANTGNPIDLIKYAGYHYTGAGLKTFLAQQGVVRKYYKSNDGGATYTQLGANDIEYICNEDGNLLTYKSISGSSNPLKDYRVMVSLKEESGYKYYTTVDGEPNPSPSSATETTAAAIAQEWQSRFGELKYWKNGNTYFYTEIKHNSESSFANYGVVRNHLYKLTVNSLTGMGTPVPNEDKTIIPERPEDDKESYISAEIQILKYRIVEQSVDLH